MKERYLNHVSLGYSFDEICKIPIQELELHQADPFYPRFWEERLYHPWSGKPRGIFPCDMSDLFGIGIPEEWTRTVLNLCRKHEQNRYYLLTKQPQRLPEFSPFPENCWVGVTATQDGNIGHAESYLSRVEATVKYISIEPMLERMVGVSPVVLKESGINWLIIGACTGTLPEMTLLAEKYPELWLAGYGNKITAQPRIEWVREIVEAADKAGIKVFLKNNLNPLFEGRPTQEIVDMGFAMKHKINPSAWQLRQELPE